MTALLDRLMPRTQAARKPIGLALQGTFSNFASGVMLILFRPYAIGDVVTTAGSEGEVEEIQIFNTILRTADGKMVIIPNPKQYGNAAMVLGLRQRSVGTVKAR